MTRITKPAKLQSWGRRAKAPKGQWMRSTPGQRDRSDAAKGELAASRELDRKLDRELGRAEWVDDLLVACGYPASGDDLEDLREWSDEHEVRGQQEWNDDE